MPLSEVIETRAAKIYLDENRVVRIILTGGLDTDEDGRVIIAAVDKITGSQKYLHIIDFSGIAEITPGTGNFYKLEETFRSVSVSAAALILGRTIDRPTAEFFVRLVKKPGSAMKLFNNEEKALNWLKSFAAARFEAEQYAAMRNLAILDFKETKTAFIISGDDGIIRISAFCETHGLEDAKEVIAAFKQIVKDKKYPVLIDSSNVKDMSQESIKYYGSDEAMISVAIIAIIIKSGISRVMANFFMDIDKKENLPEGFLTTKTKPFIG